MRLFIRNFKINILICLALSTTTHADEYGYFNLINSLGGDTYLHVHQGTLSLNEQGYRSGTFSGPLAFRAGKIVFTLSADELESRTIQLDLKKDEYRSILALKGTRIDDDGEVVEFIQPISVPPPSKELRAIYIGDHSAISIQINGHNFDLKKQAFVIVEQARAPQLEILHNGKRLSRTTLEESGPYLIVISNKDSETLIVTTVWGI